MKKIGLFLLTAAVVAGCHSDIYYQNRAVERARKFLLNNNQNFNQNDRLSVADINYVRFNAPVLLHAPVLGDGSRSSRSGKLESDLQQICVTWLVPGRKNLYMVFGVSGARMDYWFPDRVLLRTYNQNVPALVSVLNNARSFAQNNFYPDMSVREINHVRFSYPYLLRTDIAINYEVDFLPAPEKAAKLRKEAGSKVQYSLVWQLDGRNLVITMLADKGLKNAGIVFAGFLQEEELKMKTLSVIMTPDEASGELPDREK